MPGLLFVQGGDLVDQLVTPLREDESISVHEAASINAAIRNLDPVKHKYLLLDFDFHESEALPFLRRVRRQTPLTDVIALQSQQDAEPGLIDFAIDKSLTTGEMRKLLKDAFEIRLVLDDAGMVGHSENLKDAARRIRQVGGTDVSVLVTGPSGTGKELVARALHYNSPRRDNEFVSINCASIPETLLESELFGYEKGAFTGADHKQIGLFQQAHKGTIFLDEIGEMHPRLQAKLLRAIDTKTFIPVGGRKGVSVDVRIVAATNRDLQSEVDNGNFRADLYYRIGVITIRMLRLAERTEDILPIIANYFGRLKRQVGFSPEATELILRYGWPGNVRELTNFLQRILITDPKGEITKETVSGLLDRQAMSDRSLPVVTNVAPEETGYRLIYQALINLANEISEMKKLLNNHFAADDANEHKAIEVLNEGGDLEEMEEKLIRETLAKVGGNRKKAAMLLGIGERTLYRKLKKYNLV